MSEYVECKTKFKDRKALLEALAAMGFVDGEVEVHDDPQHLYGYQGDKRPQKAHIIIRRKYVGGSSNDIGFVRGEDGSYEAVISEFDRGSGGRHAKEFGGYNDKFLGALTAHYNEKLYSRKAREKGVQVKKQVVKGKVILTLTPYK